VLDPFQFLLIAVSGWMNHRQLQVIEYLREENRVLREQREPSASLYEICRAGMLGSLCSRG
jgi:hypothetical protein